MKYKNLVGRKFDFTGFKYFCSHWPSGYPTGLSRGTEGMEYSPVSFHQICEKPGPLKGVECVHEIIGNMYFIYPISELERTGQLTTEDLLTPQINNLYEIY